MFLNGDVYKETIEIVTKKRNTYNHHIRYMMVITHLKTAINGANITTITILEVYFSQRED